VERQYRRPWWLVVNKPAGLITKIQEESGPEGRSFVIRGEPLVQGLAWLTWGPVGALVVVAILAGLAATFNVREQSGLVRALMIGAFLLLPALAWGMVTVVANRLSQKHLEAERQAEAQECYIRLNQKEGELSYKISTTPQEVTLPYRSIHGVRLTLAIGARNGKARCLTLDTENGPIVLLGQALGAQAQKADLAQVIQLALDNYANK